MNLGVMAHACGGSQTEVGPKQKFRTLPEIQLNPKKPGGVAQVLDQLLSKGKDLSSSHSNAKKKKEKEEGEEEEEELKEEEDAKKKKNGGWMWSSVVKHLPSMFETLVFDP
jgi:hypothetical protein